MRLQSFRTALLASLVIAGFVSASFAMADQKIKTKSNIKNDRMAEASSSASCDDQKEGSADGTVACKTVESKSSASSAPSKAVDAPKP